MREKIDDLMKSKQASIVEEMQVKNVDGREEITR
jgi:hypothetical protein